MFVAELRGCATPLPGLRLACTGRGLPPLQPNRDGNLVNILTFKQALLGAMGSGTEFSETLVYYLSWSGDALNASLVHTNTNDPVGVSTRTGTAQTPQLTFMA